MANNTHKYGFRWARDNNGRDCPLGVEYTVADSYQGKADDTSTSVDLVVGDPVKMVNTGTVALAVTTNDVWGICVGIRPYWNGSAMTPASRLPGATTGGGLLERKSRVLVVPVEEGWWEIDVDENTTATTEAAYLAFIFENADHTCVGDVTNASRPKADPRLDISGHNTTNTLGWRIQGISKTMENQDFSGTNVKLIVSCNNIQVFDGTSGNVGTGV